MTNSFFFEEIFKGWKRPVIEANGYKFIKNDKGYMLIANTLGISKSDLTLELKKKIFTLKGETKNQEIDFTNKVNYQLDLSKIDEDIEEIEYTVENGLTIVQFKVSSEPEKHIPIININ